jgi:hypothetical protein
LLTLVVLTLLLSACAGVPDLERLETPRYQTGKSEGAAFCATCHPDTYDQWRLHSRHAQATSSKTFRAAREEILDNPVLGGFMSHKMCHSCHGDPDRNAGIDCIGCHGAPLPDVDIMVTHEQKYTPRLKQVMRKDDFCARCHQVAMPITGVPLTTVHSEWRASPAARHGQTCQSCHMPKEDGSYAFHGFSTLVRNPGLYQGRLALGQLRVVENQLRLTVANRVAGHAIPAGGPTRVLALELELKDAGGKIVHRDTRRFFKHFSMVPIVGGVPFMLIDNSQLQAGEKRRVGFDLPAAALAVAREARLALRMYEVADKYEGDIGQAHWRSAPLATARLALAR